MNNLDQVTTGMLIVAGSVVFVLVLAAIFGFIGSRKNGGDDSK